LKAKYINPYTDFGFKKLFGEEASKNFDEKELAEYEESLKVYRDLKGMIDTSFEEGEKVGFDKGKKEGLEEGKYENAREVAKAMKIKGYPIEDISELTKIPGEEIEKV
jgi:predicted transposase/invertase (TIGR01784 family)